MVEPLPDFLWSGIAELVGRLPAVTDDGDWYAGLAVDGPSLCLREGQRPCTAGERGSGSRRTMRRVVGSPPGEVATTSMEGRLEAVGDSSKCSEPAVDSHHRGRSAMPLGVRCAGQLGIAVTPGGANRQDVKSDRALRRGQSHESGADAPRDTKATRCQVGHRRPRRRGGGVGVGGKAHAGAARSTSARHDR